MAMLGLLHLGRQYGEARLEAACFRALRSGAVYYRSVKPILKHELDRVRRAAEEAKNPAATPRILSARGEASLGGRPGIPRRRKKQRRAGRIAPGPAVFKLACEGASFRIYFLNLGELDIKQSTGPLLLLQIHLEKLHVMTRRGAAAPDMRADLPSQVGPRAS